MRIHRSSAILLALFTFIMASVVRLEAQSTDGYSTRLTGDGAVQAAFSQPSATVFINELHYDNASGDVGEFVEIAGPAGTDLSGWSVVLYNGSSSSLAPYGTISLSGTVDDENGGCGALAFAYAGIQNGGPDGLALVDASNTLIQFLSYEGSFTGASGVAGGVTSTDMGVAETSSTPIGDSLQLTGGPGSTYQEFTWSGPSAESPGSLNSGQNATGCGTTTDNPPVVTSTSPADGASGVAVDATVSVTFNEAVTFPASVDIVCTSGTQSVTPTTGDNLTFTLPHSDFTAGDSCTVTIPAASIADQDDTPDNPAAAVTWSFTMSAACGGPATLISAIQGSGAASPLAGASVTVEAIVVGDFEVNGLTGYFVQEEDDDADTDPLTSEGIFIYDGNGVSDVDTGDLVRLTGEVSEFYGLTEIKSLTEFQICSSGNTLPVPTDVTLPETIDGDMEQFEGMYVHITNEMTVAQTYFLGRYGQLTLSSAGRLYQPTNQELPGSAAAIALADSNARNILFLDDGMDQTACGDNPDPVPYLGGPPPAIIRAGDTVSNLYGVLDFGPIDSGDTGPCYGGPSVFGRDFRLQPTQAPVFTATNPRTATPDDPGGTLKVASFNVLNYFNGDGSGGGFPTARGADTLAEFERQSDKIVQAITLMNADIIGLMELENDGYTATSAIAELVSRLNAEAGAGTYAFIDPGVSAIGTDEITVGLIYKPDVVTLVGSAAILDAASFTDPNNTGTPKSRPALAQTFADASGEKLTIAVNHLKSKGSSCGAGDDDVSTGQGNCNDTRTKGAIALAAWLATDPTSSGDPDFLIIGDLNAYAMEDPITALKNAGYTDLINSLLGATAYSYIFDGQSGYLDHAMASSTLAAQVTSADAMGANAINRINSTLATQATGVTEWHINADEPAVIDYNQDFNPAGYYTADAYRSADHDPVILGLNLGTVPVTLSWFRSSPGPDGVAFSWQTATETGTAGFNILAETADGLVQINPQLIQSQLIDALEPSDYAVTLATDAALFYLQEVALSGATERFGPFQLGQEYGSRIAPDPISGGYSIYLPFMRSRQ